MGRATANNTITNHPGISDTASSGEMSVPEVKITSNIMVGINQTQSPKINQ